MADPARRRLILALDFERLARAYALARRLAGQVGHFKIGSQLFTSEGPQAVERLSRLGPGIFLDLKFHDIPNTVAGAVSAAASLRGVRMMTVHALGGAEMMRAARKALPRRSRAKLLGVTLLTSLDRAAARRVGIRGTPRERVIQLARLAKSSGLHGVVAAATEARAIRRACGRDFLIVVPGIRPGKRREAADDQSRVATPGEAFHAGADHIVVGRPITAARDPVAAAESILAEIRAALRQRV